MPGSTTSRILLAYYSRPGENYWHGGRRNLKTGNTEVVAGLIADRIDCDVFRIEAAHPYSDDYDDTVARNSREQDDDTRPAIANALPSAESYDTILLGSPIWNVRPAMIMSTFLEGIELGTRTLLPFVTYAVSGLGTTRDDYARLAPGATIGQGLAVLGEEARDGAKRVDAWLTAAGLTG